MTCSDRLTPLDCDEQLPAVPNVKLGQDALNIPPLAAGQTVKIDLTETVLAFKGDSADFVNEAAAREVLANVATTLTQHGYRVSVVGHTANMGSGGGEDLSLARAQKVADTLVALGVEKEQITQVTGVGSRDSTSFKDGWFNEAQASLDRKVCLTVSA